MKKISTSFFCTALAVILSMGSAFAQPGSYYKKWLHNQTFDGLETLPTGWSNPNNNQNDANHATTPASIFGRSGGSELNNNMFRWITTSNGNGYRGADLRFPTTPTEANPSGDADFDATKVWQVEFDWNTAAATLTHGNPLSLILCGNNSSNVRNATTWYADAILGLFVMGDNKFHYWNMDLVGYPVPDASGNPTETFMGPAFTAGQYPAFNRVWKSDAINADSTYKANKATETAVTFAYNATYHIKASLNFETQKVDSLTITDVANPDNSQTIYDMPFLAPSTAGADCAIAIEDRKVSNLSLINVGDPRSTNVGNFGGGSVHTTYIDNLEVYVWKESLGKADVTINYKDREGNVVKTARVATEQEVGFIYSLLTEDKADFNDGTNFYFYDEAATHAANASKGTGENVTIDFSTTPGVDNSLTVVFKKVPITAGTYVWSGANGNDWNYLNENFSVAGGAPMSYQAGNAVEFSNATPTNDSIAVIGEVDLGENNVTIAAPGYQITGPGRIVGTGSLLINAPVTLAADIRLKGGATVTADSVYIKHVAAADSFTIKAPVAKLVMQAGATFTKDIVGEGGTLNLDWVSLNEYASAISNFSTINIHQKTQTSLSSATWRTALGGTLPDSCQVNYYNDVEGNPVPNGLGATGTVLQRVSLNLGPHTRLVRNYNENANNNDVLYVGALSGDATARLEGGFIDGRYFTYNIGGLNTDAVFNGEIAAFTKSFVAATDTTEAVTNYAVNGFAVTKSGTGTWTVNNNVNFPASTRGSRVNVAGGKFVINGNIDFPNTTKEGSQINVTDGVMEINGTVTFVNDTAAHVIKVAKGTLQLGGAIVAPAVSQLTLTVDTTGVLKTNNVAIGAYNVIVSGVVEGGGDYANAFSLTDSAAVLKLKVTSFEEGGFEAVKTLGDISIMAGTIDITVTNMPTENKEIIILASQGNYNIMDNIDKIKVLVNGEDITANTVDTEIPEDSYGIYYFDPEQGALGFLKGLVGLDRNVTTKEIKSVEYYNVLGQRVYHNNDGYSIQKITFTDGSVKTVKVFNKTK